MQIKKVDLPAQPALGLKAIKMERLGRTVVIAGKNGAGKTRFLGRLTAWTNDKTVMSQSVAELCQRFWKIPGARHNFQHLSRNGWWKDDKAWASFASAVMRPDVNPTEFRAKLYELDFDEDELPEIVKFVPKVGSMVDPRELSPAKMHELSAKAQAMGMSEMDKNALARVQTLQNQWWEAGHQQSQMPDKDKADAFARYENLKVALERALQTTLRRDANGNATLFGFPLGEARLSDGQRIILQWFVALTAQTHKLPNAIILMDEPENSLHPSALLDVISATQALLTDGQLWIATHSVSVLSHVEPDNIWWVAEGAITHVGSQPETVLADLVGDEARREKLCTFVGLPADLAAVNFARQCLTPPAVVYTDERDPQLRQIREMVTKHSSRVRILDYGAGRGRLASALARFKAEAKDRPIDYDYYALDHSDIYKEQCETAVADLHPMDSESRCFYDEASALAAIPSCSVDVVVMCNVLHEIDPIQWEGLFAQDAVLRRLLKPDGWLLMVEDNEMRIGELAHRFGFIVLDTTAMGSLFKITDTSRFLVDDARNDGRLMAHLIGTEHLTKVSRETIAEALRKAQAGAAVQIKEIRQNPSAGTFSMGRKHAYLVQQHANAQLALDELAVLAGTNQP